MEECIRQVARVERMVRPNSRLEPGTLWSGDGITTMMAKWISSSMEMNVRMAHMTRRVALQATIHRLTSISGTVKIVIDASMERLMKYRSLIIHCLQRKFKTSMTRNIFSFSFFGGETH
jgi:hypothetical protein